MELHYIDKHNKVTGKIANSAAIRITFPKRTGSVKRKMGLKKKAYSQGVTIPLRSVDVNMTTF